MVCCCEWACNVERGGIGGTPEVLDPIPLAFGRKPGELAEGPVSVGRLARIPGSDGRLGSEESAGTAVGNGSVFDRASGRSA